jgi:hypothetical protein
MKNDSWMTTLRKRHSRQGDYWAIIATALSAGFIGWIVVGTPERSALRRDQHETARAMSSDPGLLRISQNSPHMRDER